MKILEVADRTPDLINQLLEVWEKSVRATHLFLSDREIKNIKEYVPQALNGIAHLMIAADEAGRAVAFMGIEDSTLEMLFISPEGLKTILLNGWRSMSRTRRLRDFMNTWAFMFTRGQTLMNRETPTLCCI